MGRRSALVPPKLIPTDAENDDDKNRKLSEGSSENGTARNRRSSMVVIPPMQICPGDLLVYSKVLTQRSNLIESHLYGSAQSLAAPDTDSNCSRKGRTTWSILKLFDRSGRSLKSESLSGIEQVLMEIRPSEFRDEQLHRYKGLPWADFVYHVEAGTVPPVVPTPTSSSGAAPAAADSLSRLERSESAESPCELPARVRRPRPPSTLTRTLSERSLTERRGLFRRRLVWTSFDRSPTATPPVSAVASPESPARRAATAGDSPPTERRCHEAVWDLFQSEYAFLYDHLMVLKNVYMEPLKQVQVEGYLMVAEPELLFGNLDELCCVTYAFCKDFIKTLLSLCKGEESVSLTGILSKLFLKNNKSSCLSQSYHRYALNYINALNYLETLRRHNDFCEFEKWCNRDPRCKKLQLTDLLVAPVQHSMKVPLMLRDIQNKTESQEERQLISTIIENEEASLRELDDKMKWLKNFERLLEIQRNLVWPSVMEMDPKAYIPEFLRPALARQPCERLIVSPRRQIIMEGPLQLADAGKPIDMHVILFDDMLLITRRKKGLSKKKSSITEGWSSHHSRGLLHHEAAVRYVVHKQPLSLDRFFLHNIGGQDAVASRLEGAFVVVHLNRFQQIAAVYTLLAQSEQVKTMWITKLREAQDKWKRTLQNTVFRATTPEPRLRAPSGASPQAHHHH
ncbi:pleckstrin homology domain-containing family G member 5-like isoform X2 [Amphibalanus amphitrite]|nr:pleckstrin homology domain-containing family G member 5-like isoform X2 [Amphibalanus amphitrite]